jgi:hypothetical protein
MTMGPFGVHWDRGQTWWPLVKDYHLYVARCSHILRQGVAVSDILYLTPEGAPHVFRAPNSALEGSGPLADKKGYGFDGCSPNILTARAEVRNGRIVFGGGTSYRLMVLPQFETMTPELLAKVEWLVKAGAVAVGLPPVKSPSLSNYPECDRAVKSLGETLWGSLEVPKEITRRQYGKGSIYWGQKLYSDDSLYPHYEHTAALLKKMGLSEDFICTGPVRYTHRRTEDLDIYFVSNRSNQQIDTVGTFRAEGGQPELWHPVHGERRKLADFTIQAGTTSIPLRFEAYESYFILFARQPQTPAVGIANRKNFPAQTAGTSLEGPWEVFFDPAWGGPERITFDPLLNWAEHDNEGIKYYSGIATYRKSFDCSADTGSKGRAYLDLGTVHDMARVRLNGKDLGVVWCAPWRIEITDVLGGKDNRLEIEVANRWINRLIGDEQPGNKDVRTVKWSNGMLEGTSYPTGRYTFTTYRCYKAGDPLVPSGLLGPVTIRSEEAFAY